jgi:hypothetical protein
MAAKIKLKGISKNLYFSLNLTFNSSPKGEDRQVLRNALNEKKPAFITQVF